MSPLVVSCASRAADSKSAAAHAVAPKENATCAELRGPRGEHRARIRKPLRDGVARSPRARAPTAPRSAAGTLSWKSCETARSNTHSPKRDATTPPINHRVHLPEPGAERKGGRRRAELQQHSGARGARRRQRAAERGERGGARERRDRGRRAPAADRRHQGAARFQARARRRWPSCQV